MRDTASTVRPAAVEPRQQRRRPAIQPAPLAVNRGSARPARPAQLRRQLLRLVEAHSQAMALFGPDGQLRWLNTAMAQAVQASAGAGAHCGAGQLLGQLGLALEAQAQLDQALTLNQPFSLTLRRQDTQGQMHWGTLDWQMTLDERRRHDGWLATYSDATEQHHARAVLAHTVATAGLGAWQWNMRSDQLEFNERLLSMLGYRDGDLAPTMKAWSALVHPEDQAAWLAALRQHLANPDMPCRVELRVRRPDGDWAAVLSCGVVIARGEDGKPQRMAGINIDLTEQRQMQAMLRHAALTDGLTQLPNRAAMFDQVQQAIDRARAQADFSYAVLFMDFDRFKLVNDTLGHAAGDELLRQIAHRLRHAVRAGDTVRQGVGQQHHAGRIGGDEFVVVLEGVRGRDEAAVVARRLIDVLSEPYDLGTHRVQSTASIGIVTSELAANDANTVMRDADTAMYEAKRQGRGRWVVFDPSMHERVAHGLSVEQDLRRALAQGELFVDYQPVVPLQPGAALGAEALLRWRHPQRGLVPPMQFIPLAEENGLIVPLGLFVLGQACRQFMAWQAQLGERAPSTVSVNLSPRQLQAPSLLEDVRRCLTDHGMPATALQLEVTESWAAQDDQARARLQSLKDLGITIALDDFGTGYSSLSCLHQLPLHTVKVDRSFVMHAETSAYHRVLIEATVRVAQALGMSTVAEGIETQGQCDLMRALGCARGQGYLFSRPLSPEAMDRWLRGAQTGEAPAQLADRPEGPAVHTALHAA